jgi:alpha-L-arabinofuranosidase
VKVVNASDKAQSPLLKFSGEAKLNAQVIVTTLAASLNGLNSIDDPSAVKPAEKTISLKGKNLPIMLEPHSFSVIKIKTR